MRTPFYLREDDNLKIIKVLIIKSCHDIRHSPAGGVTLLLPHKTIVCLKQCPWPKYRLKTIWIPPVTIVGKAVPKKSSTMTTKAFVVKDAEWSLKF